MNYDFTLNKKDEEEIKCNICFDTNETNEMTIKLSCNHTFHIKCISEYILINDVCPMCRSEISRMDKLTIDSNNEWTINPFTKRKIKIGGKTYRYLIEKGVFNK
jgi:hypothetical protein